MSCINGDGFLIVPYTEYDSKDFFDEEEMRNKEFYKIITQTITPITQKTREELLKTQPED